MSYQCLKTFAKLQKTIKIDQNLEQKHQAVETINDSIRNYLVRISTKAITKADVERLAVMFDVNRSILKSSRANRRVCRSIKTPT